MSLIGKITIQTAWLPDITVDPNGPPSIFAPILKPKITVDVAGNPVIVEPYGEPGPSKWSYALGGIVFLALFIWVLKK